MNVTDLDGKPERCSWTMNMQGYVCAHSVNVGSGLVVGPFVLGRRPVDKRRPHIRMRESG
jgi:hypothetical protein